MSWQLSVMWSAFELILIDRTCLQRKFWRCMWLWNIRFENWNQWIIPAIMVLDRLRIQQKWNTLVWGHCLIGSRVLVWMWGCLWQTGTISKQWILKTCTKYKVNNCEENNGWGIPPYPAPIRYLVGIVTAHFQPNTKLVWPHNQVEPTTTTTPPPPRKFLMHFQMT